MTKGEGLTTDLCSSPRCRLAEPLFYRVGTLQVELCMQMMGLIVNQFHMGVNKNGFS